MGTVRMLKIYFDWYMDKDWRHSTRRRPEVGLSCWGRLFDMDDWDKGPVCTLKRNKKQNCWDPDEFFNCCWPPMRFQITGSQQMYCCSKTKPGNYRTVSLTFVVWIIGKFWDTGWICAWKDGNWSGTVHMAIAIHGGQCCRWDYIGFSEAFDRIIHRRLFQKVRAIYSDACR